MSYVSTKMRIARICNLGMLTALYVVLGALMKIPIIGNISLDLGYAAYAVALYRYKWKGIAVGVIGCALESILFSAYGFSISWVVMNLTIGLLFCAMMHARYSPVHELKPWKVNKDLVVFTVVSVLAGAILKGGIECVLYGIPVIVKLPKVALAFAMDSAAMLLGFWIYFKSSFF